MSHLGALITPYVDGELSPARSAEAREHLSVCQECRSALAMEQAARRRTQESARGVQASAELTARLLAMPAGPLPPAAPLSRRPRLAPFVLGGGATLVGLFVLTLFVLGATRAEQTPSSLLAATADTDGAAATTGSTGLLNAASDPLEAVSTTVWALPASLSVQQLQLIEDGSTQTLELLASTRYGDVRILEREGTLDASTLGSAVSDTIAGRTVYLVDGWYLLESGPCVVAVLGDNEAAAEAVIAQLPAADADGTLDRIVDGWHVLAG